MNPAWVFNVDKVHEWAYWDAAFTPQECALIVNIGSHLVPKPAEVIEGSKKELDTNIRKSNIAWIHPTEETSWVYRRLTDIVLELNSRYFNFDVFGVIEAIQFTEYTGDKSFYGKHSDRGLGVVVRKLSLSVQLSDSENYEGGNLVLHTSNQPSIMKREIGSLSIFPSFTLHEVTPVTKGTRHSLVAWVSGKQFT
jgi:PKHD-type hydroxylase